MSKQTLFIIISVTIIAISSVGLILNSELNKIANGFGVSDLDAYYQEAASPPASGSDQTAPGANNVSGTAPPGAEYSPTDAYFSGNSEQERIAAEIESRINRPVNRKDLLKAGLILMGSLSREELNYIYQVGRNPHPSKAEMIEAREILLNNLSAQDIAALRQIGSNYGMSLRILDPSVPIR